VHTRATPSHLVGAAPVKLFQQKFNDLTRARGEEIRHRGGRADRWFYVLRPSQCGKGPWKTSTEVVDAQYQVPAIPYHTQERSACPAWTNHSQRAESVLLFEMPGVSACHKHRTNRSAVKLPSEDGMLPESWLLFRYSPLYVTKAHLVTAAGIGTRVHSRPSSL
jgi:hypothetical protein